MSWGYIALPPPATVPGETAGDEMKPIKKTELQRVLRLTEIKLPLDHAEDALPAAVLARLGIKPVDLIGYTIFRRAWDARKKSAISLIYTLDVEVRDEKAVLKRLSGDKHVSVAPDVSYKFVTKAPPQLSTRPIVIGTGPCGLLAALTLAQMGFRPIILERGKVVRERTKDTWGLWRRSVLNPESNVQFGEGGAGTFSDGKLYSQIKDPNHHGRKVLTEFVKAGAPDEILYVAKPHIGTFRLVTIVESIRQTIEDLGGEYRFSSKVVDLDIEESGGQRRVRGVVLENGEHLASDHVVLAVGHSARDTFEMLHRRGVFIEAKPFSIGVRIEHPQSLIDKCRFGPSAGHPILGAADYKLVHHASNGRSVYSFCMCPGGTVVAAASEPGRVVTNGMSQYSRAERNANSGIVVGITPEPDYPGHPLAGIAFQRHWEERAFEIGGGTYAAPAQRVGDFLAGRPSTSLGDVVPSYKPGVTPADLSLCLPDYAVAAILEALPAFDHDIKGYSLDDAVMTGVETRTSSPIRIRRDDHYQSIGLIGLYPAGEGAGYAGGILSAGVDGIRVAEAVALSMTNAATQADPVS
jgi:uncharacterized FAD-dependent dehydrogenase